MNKIVINTRDELIVIYPEQIAYVEADGNYSQVYYIVDHKENKFTLPYGISKVEDMIKKKFGKKYNFVKVGRSLILNRKYIARINTYDCEVLLSDFGAGVRKLRDLPKLALKGLKRAEMQRGESEIGETIKA